MEGRQLGPSPSTRRGSLEVTEEDVWKGGARARVGGETRNGCPPRRDAVFHLERGDDPEEAYKGHAELFVVWVDPTRTAYSHVTQVQVAPNDPSTSEVLPLVPDVATDGTWMSTTSDPLGYASLEPEEDAFSATFATQLAASGEIRLEPRPRLAWDLMDSATPSEAEAAFPFGWNDPDQEVFSAPLGLLTDEGITLTPTRGPV